MTTINGQPNHLLMQRMIREAKRQLDRCVHPQVPASSGDVFALGGGGANRFAPSFGLPNITPQFWGNGISPWHASTLSPMLGSLLGGNFVQGGVPSGPAFASAFSAAHCLQQQMAMAMACACFCPCGPHSSPFSPSPDSSSSSPGSGKMWDVWFDHQDGQKAKQLSPIVLDLNGNGRPDITGKNIKGDGKISGEAIDFDLDPTKRSWTRKSIRRRPGKGAPRVKGGTANIYDDNGQLLRKGVSLREAFKIKNGRAEIVDRDGKLAGEFKQTNKGMMYHWGTAKAAEKTEWLTKNGGDGLLVWDVNGDGKIDSSKELFGNFDVDGTKRFANGYEKLAAHFDLDRNGRVEGAELARAQAMGVQIWKDDGDGKTEAGELRSLDQHQIRTLSTQFDERDMSSTYEAAPNWPRWW